MLLLAVTAVEKLKALKPEVWLKIGIAVFGFVAVIVLWRRIMKMNKFIVGIVVFVSLTVLFFSWVYNRNEPAFLTPFVNIIAPFFPSGVK